MSRPPDCHGAVPPHNGTARTPSQPPAGLRPRREVAVTVDKPGDDGSGVIQIDWEPLSSGAGQRALLKIKAILRLSILVGVILR
jgi:hypothetical protein